MSAVYVCARAIAGGAERRNFAFAVEDGVIRAAGDAASVRPRFAQHPVRAFGPDVIVLPGFINAHSHAYQILLRGWADDLTFQKWRTDALYHVVPRLAAQDIYWTFAAAFCEMLAGGITSVVEFFYLNGAGNAHAQAAIRAARDTGIRLTFARTWMDAPYAPPEFRETIALAAERTGALAEEFPDLDLCVAPHSLHAASPEMIAASMEFASERNMLVHVHVAEAEYEGEQTLKAHGATPVAFLDRLGVLNERIVAVHAIYITEEEKDLLAERGARVVHNPMTNQYLGDGTCDVTGLLRRGVPVALGTDADVKPSLIEEMRAASLLQKLEHRDGAALGARTAFDLGTAQGARALAIPAGDLREGLHADFCVLDAAGIDPWSPAVNGVVYRGENRWIKETYVAGRQVYNAANRSDLEKDAGRALVQLAQTLKLGG